MGISLSAAALILFVGIATVIPHAYTNAVTDGYFRAQDAAHDMDKMASEQRNTAISVTNYSVSGGNLSLVIENTGAVEINPIYVNVLVDGAPVTATYDDVMLFPLSSINATVQAPGTGAHRIKVVTIRGNTAYSEVSI